MRDLLRSSVAAARIAADDPELWIPGALASLAFLAWLPLILAVVPLPSAADLAFFGADLYTSSHWPLNAVELVAGSVLLVAGASVLVALGEAALLGRLGGRSARRALADETARLWLVQLVAALPAIAAAALLVAATAAVAPGEYQSPDIGGSLGVRIARDVAPLGLLLVATVLFGQALGAAGTRRLALEPASGLGAALGSALAAGLRDLRTAAGRVAGLAVASLFAYLAALLVGYLVLRLLWSPIGAQLAQGRLAGPQTLLLLVGFVAIWLCLLIGLGVLHAWASAWWTLELERGKAGPLEATSAEEIGQA